MSAIDVRFRKEVNSVMNKRPMIKYDSLPVRARRSKPRGQTLWGVRKGSILETMTRAMANPGGATFREIVAACRTRHPDHDPISIATSIRTQLYRLPREHKGLAIVKRGNAERRAYQLVPKRWYNRRQ